MLYLKSSINLFKCFLKSKFTRSVHLSITPRIALIDEACAITASDIKPNSKVTLRVETKDEIGRLFRSHAHFVANSEGNIDLTKDESIGGSYKGLYPMGLFVGLSTLDPKTKHARLHRRNKFIPWKMSASIHEGHSNITDEVNAICTVELERHLVSPGVKRIPIKQGRVRGMLYVPPGPGPHPGILDLHGGVGGLIDHRGALQASRGIASLALAYFNYDDLLDNLETIELDMFFEAVDVLTSHPEVIPDRCGIWSFCQGSLYSYLLADKYDKVTAVVAVNGNIIPFWSQIFYKNKMIDLETVNISSKHMDFDKNLIATYKPDFIKEMLDPNNKKTINIGYGSSNTSYLFISGGQCSLGGPRLCNVMIEKLNKIGNDKVHHLHYESAGHLIEPPYLLFSEYVHSPYWPYKEGGPNIPTKGIYLGLGGSVESSHTAMEDMWPKALSFLNKEIKSKSLWYQQSLKKSGDRYNS